MGKDETGRCTRTARKYDRFSIIYDLIELPVEKGLFSSLRKKALASVEGKVLEVGIGTGKNLPYYPPGLALTGIDFSKKMLERAERKKRDLALVKVTLLEMDVEHLGFQDESFDTVVSTFVFCTVPQPLKGLQEVHRVLKRGGLAIFLEHMKSDNLMLNIPLYMMHGFTKTLIGTSMLRETQKNIERAGFLLKEVQKVYFDIVRLIVAAK